jgi:hypothetical protein
VTEEVDLFNVNTRSARLLDTLGANAGESLNTIAKAEYDNATTNVRYCNGSIGGATAVKSYVTSKMTATGHPVRGEQAERQRGDAVHPDGHRQPQHRYEPDSRGLLRHLPRGRKKTSATSPAPASWPVEQYGGYTETMPFEFGACLRRALVLDSGCDDQPLGGQENRLDQATGARPTS